MLTSLLFSCLPALAAPPQNYACTDIRARVVQGQAGPESGQILASTLPYGASFTVDGRVAFVAAITGTARNQAVMVSDGQSLRAIAVGCGGPGGSGAPGACGDPTPIGGTFAGFFTDTWMAPATNEAGDVLFLADVFGATSPRALFLYRASTGTIETVAAVGDLSPSGANINALGPGSLDSAGNVAFFARTAPGLGTADEILADDNGTLSLVAGVGSIGPSGIPYELLAAEFQLMADGTVVPIGGVPARDDAGRFAHYAWEAQSMISGLVLVTPGQAPVWIASRFAPAPGGGGFERFYGPSFTPSGEIVFSARHTNGSGFRTSVFVGLPGNLRRLIGTLDPIGTSTCIAIERSRSPFRTVGPNGEVVVWVQTQRPDQSLGEAVVVKWPNGVLEILAEQGQTSPLGGTIVKLSTYPSIDDAGRVLVSAQLAGGPTQSAAWLVVPCGTPVTLCQGKPSSLGCVPRILTSGRASATSSAPFVVTADSLPSGRRSILFYGLGAAATPFHGGTLCVTQPLRRTAVQTSTGPLPSDCSGTLSLDFGARIASGTDPLLTAGTTIAAQWFVRDPLDPSGFSSTLSDAILFTIAP